jgi:hypothetical protein
LPSDKGFCATTVGEKENKAEGKEKERDIKIEWFENESKQEDREQNGIINGLINMEEE